MVVHTAIVPLRGRRPATLLGSGQVEMQHQALEDGEVGVTVVDALLTPVQQRNLERGWAAR